VPAFAQQKGTAWVRIGHIKQHISMTRSARFAPANEILAFQFPANIINRDRQRPGDQISPIKGHGFFSGMIINSDLIRISPFRRSANENGVDRLTPAS
jgi:hypothetical protein